MILQPLRNPRKKGASKKSKLKGIKSREKQIRKHEDKIQRSANSPDVAHWQHEIAVFEDQNRVIEERLRRGKGKRKK